MLCLLTLMISYSSEIGSVEMHVAFLVLTSACHKKALGSKYVRFNIFKEYLCSLEFYQHMASYFYVY
jgi:hypothetical protein